MNTNLRTFSILAVLLTLISGIAGAATIEEDLNSLEEKRYEALIGGDWQELEMLLSEEFFYNTANGALLTKDVFVNYMKSGAVVVKKAVREEAGVRQYGDVALVTGVAHVDVALNGEDRTVHSRYLHVWVKNAESWKLVARQSTYLPEKK